MSTEGREQSVLATRQHERRFGHDYFLAVLDCGHERGITLAPGLPEPDSLWCFICTRPLSPTEQPRDESETP